MIFVTGSRVIIDDDVYETDGKLHAVFVDGSQLRHDGKPLGDDAAAFIARIAEVTDISPYPVVAVFSLRGFSEKDLERA